MATREHGHMFFKHSDTICTLAMIFSLCVSLLHLFIVVKMFELELKIVVSLQRQREIIIYIRAQYCSSVLQWSWNRQSSQQLGLQRIAIILFHYSSCNTSITCELDKSAFYHDLCNRRQWRHYKLYQNLDSWKLKIVLFRLRTPVGAPC